MGELINKTSLLLGIVAGVALAFLLIWGCLLGPHRAKPETDLLLLYPEFKASPAAAPSMAAPIAETTPTPLPPAYYREHHAAPTQANNLTWNAWAEDSDYEPEGWLRMGGRYRVAIDLAAFAYTQGGKEIPGHYPASRGLKAQVEEWLKLPNKPPTARATLLLLPDPAYFGAVPDPDRSREITIDLNKIRAMQQTKVAEPAGDTFEAMRNGMRDFVLSYDENNRSGRTLFPIRVLDREGWAEVGVSIWVTEKTPAGAEMLPVDEFSVPLCIVKNEERIKQDCKSPSPSTAVFRGINAIRPVVENAPMPDAALHFVDMGAPPVYGIFRRNDQPGSNFKVWEINESFKDLVAQLEAFRGEMTDSMQNLAGAKLEEQLRNEGHSMYNVLFPPDSENGRAARAEFEAFAASDLRARSNLVRPRSIFVRMVGGDPPIQLLPISLMALPISSDKFELLGLHFKIAQPLEVQSYEPSDICIRHWMTVLPDEDTATSTSLSDLRDGIEHWPSNWSRTMVEDDSAMHKLRAFVTGPGPESATALTIMSHQSKNSVWFADGQPLDSAAVQVTFNQPSLVVLAGCDTARPESWGFIRQFNRQGVATAIATATEIKPALAADFMLCLTETLGTGISDVGDTYMGTLNCLEHKPWGSTALTFLLLGNSNLKLCAPSAQSAPVGDSE